MPARPANRRRRSLTFGAALRWGGTMLVGSFVLLPILAPRGPAAPETPAPMTARELLESEQYALDGPELSIGEVIDGSDLVIRATLLASHEPAFNSADGLDWNAEFEEDIDSYPVAPVPYSRLSVRVEEVLDAPDDSVSAGDLLEVHFVTDRLLDLEDPGVPLDVDVESSPLEHQILFLTWEEIWRAGPPGNRQEGATETPSWVGDDHYGWWHVDPSGDLYPGSFEHQYQLQSAKDLNALAVTVDDGRRMISQATLVALIESERASPDTDAVASFDAWPWVEPYNAESEADF